MRLPKLGFEKVSKEFVGECKSRAILYKHKKTVAAGHVGVEQRREYGLRCCLPHASDSFLFVDCFELLGSFILCISALLMVLLPRSITRSENVGFISVLWIVSKWCTFWAIYISCFVENRMVFVERIKQFTNIKSEAAWEIKDCLPPPNWPTNLKIDLKELA